jgi:hypothetical protein
VVPLVKATQEQQAVTMEQSEIISMLESKLNENTESMQKMMEEFAELQKVLLENNEMTSN